MAIRKEWIVIIVASAIVLASISSSILSYASNQPHCDYTTSRPFNSDTALTNATLHIPLNIVIANGDDHNTIGYTDDQIHKFVDYSNDVWSKANIKFDIQSIKRITVPDERTTPPRNGDNKEECQFGKQYLGKAFEDSVIDVVYIKQFRDEPAGGGVTIQNGTIGAAFINEFDNDYMAEWTLSHELGHTLNLSHVTGKDNLMFNADVNTGIMEGRSTALTQDQIATARKFAYAIHCPELACIKQ